MPRAQHHSMLGMRLDYISAERFVDEFAAAAAAGRSAYCCVPDVYQCMMCRDSAAHRAIVNGADYVMSDSVVLQTARALRHGVRPVRTMLGSDLMLALCGKAEIMDIPVALIGGRDEDALSAIKSALAAQFPSLRIVFATSPPFRAVTPGEEEDMLRGLADSGAKLVFVGIGCPKQEQWMSRYSTRVDAAKIGVGAAFDTIGGRVPSSPPFVHRMGLEWLFRLLREPRRLYRRYLISAPRFVGLVLVEWLWDARRKRA